MHIYSRIESHVNSPDEFMLLHSHLKQRLQALVPLEEELCLIKEAKVQNPHSPLAPAEQCLLTLGQIPHLITRLQLWAFTLDYDSLERVRATSSYTEIQRNVVNRIY